jgi:hypothetical protein
VLDLKPRFLWVAGPDAVDPPRHLYTVEVVGKNANLSLPFILVALVHSDVGTAGAGRLTQFVMVGHTRPS